ncbi:hypothetical protein KFE25_009499 [Diacronema lutheri]|uniref:Uncharacterized protein n=1 Tax=Diacronema lutheri TaxID=2081491 RepID=A0A8J5XMQ0_DIALT|nr:hypothetical protein KFE25_009499 [Diacronema lutheri]
MAIVALVHLLTIATSGNATVGAGNAMTLEDHAALEQNAALYGGASVVATTATANGTRFVPADATPVAVADAIDALAHMSSAPPYPVVIASLLSNSIVTILVFGPPRSVQESRSALKERVRQATQLTFLLLAIACTARDVLGVWRVARDMRYGWWTRLHGALVLWLISPNVAKAFSMYSVYALHANTIKWAQMHGVPGSERLRPDDTVGFFAMKLISFTVTLYMYAAVASVAWSAPTLLAYVYVLLPTLLTIVVGGTWALAPAVRRAASALHARGRHVALEATQPLSLDAQAAALMAVESPKSFDYESQHEAFVQTGATLSGWVHFLLTPLYAPIVAAIVTTNARLVCGHGYWRSLEDTFAQRHFDAWLARMTASAQGALFDCVWLML